MDGGSMLDVVGREIVGIVCPVSICMLLVVLLVKQLQTEVSSTVLTSVANLVYGESSTDSDWTKFLGALINAGIFVAVVTVITFLLVLLFYFRCTKFLRLYMGFAAFTVLAYMGGTVAVMLIQNLAIPIDAVTAAVILYNFAVVGVMSVFFCRMPILFTQGYLILVGMLVAFWFTSLPEWTTWVLLVAISLYDLAAVLTPGGPLNLLVQLAMSRDEEIPALIYEARPVLSTVRPINLTNISARPPSDDSSSTARATPDDPNSSTNGTHQRLWKGRPVVSREGSSFLRWLSSLGIPLPARAGEQVQLQPNGETSGTPDASTRSALGMQDVLSHTECIASDQMYNSVDGPLRENSDRLELNRSSHFDSDFERTPLLRSTSMHNVVVPNGSDVRMEQEMNWEGTDDLDEGIGLGATGAIKLGLGDFIFYSVLVGRAALYDMTTVYACYLAIITGLGATLALLAVWRRALPALPISIALGVVFYFLTRFLMEPFVMQYGANLLFF